MLPVEIPRSTFDELDKIILKFIWQKKDFIFYSYPSQVEALNFQI